MRVKILIFGLISLLCLSVLSQETKKTKILSESDVVHVNLGEEIFHIEGCPLLKKESRRNMSLRYAYEKGYKPCEKCILSEDAGIKSTFIEEKFLGKIIHVKSFKEEYLENNPDLSPEIKKAILNGNVLIGMTRDQVRASRGTPHKINKRTSAYGITEQWVMHSANPRYDDLKGKEYGYIYFENGRVTSWQSW